MRVRKIAFWSFFTLFAVMVLALAWLWTADLGAFKPQLERLVTEKTGREFSIDGDFHVDLSNEIWVIAEDLRFEDAAWTSNDDMVRVGRIEIRLNLWSLLRGPILVELIDVDDADVLLVAREDRDPNWVLPIEQAPAQETDDDAAGLKVLFGQVDADNVHVLFDSAARDAPLDLRIESFSQMLRDDRYLDLDLGATLNEREILVEGELGTWDALLTGKDFRFDIDAVLGTFKLSGRGRIDDIANLLRPELVFSASGPDIDDLTRMLGVGDEGEGDIDLSGSLVPQDGGPLVLEVAGNVGMTEVEAIGTIKDLQSFDNIGLKAVASGPDLGRVLRIAGIHKVRQAPFMLKLDAETQGNTFLVNEATMVFADAQIDASARMPNFPTLDDADIKVNIEGPDIERFRYILRLPGAATGEFLLNFTLDVTDDGVEVPRLHIRNSLGEIRASGRLSDVPNYYGSEFDVQVNLNSLQEVAGIFGVTNLPDAPVEVSGSGEYVEGGIRLDSPITAIVADVAANVSGFIAMRPGIRGSDLAFNLKGPDLAELIGAFADSSRIPALPYEIDGRLQAGTDGYRFQGLEGMLGSSVVNVDGLLTGNSGLHGSRFSFRFEGPAFEELIEDAVELEVHPGSYDLSGNVALNRGVLELDDIELNRERGSLSADVEVSLPPEPLVVDFDVRARGSDVRHLFNSIDEFEALPQPFELTGRGELKDQRLSIDKFTARVGDAQTEASGDIVFAAAGDNATYRSRGEVPSLASLGSIGGRRLSDQRLAWNATVTSGGGVIATEITSLVIGDSEAHGSFHYQPGPVPNLKINVESDLIVSVPLVEQEEEPAAEPPPKFEDGRLIPDADIPFEKLASMNANVQIRIGELQRNGYVFRDIEFRSELQDGALEISKLGITTRSGRYNARGKLAPADGVGELSLESRGKDIVLVTLTATTADKAMVGDIGLKLESTGTDLRTLAANANGTLFVDTRGGQIVNNRFFQLIYGDAFGEIIGVINPFQKGTPYTDFSCIVMPLRITDGRVQGPARMLVRTDKLNIFVKPDIDLETEKIDITVRTTPRKGITISAAELLNPYIAIVGTLAKPTLAVDEQGVLVSGGAAVATAGLSILAKAAWDRMSRSKDPCGDASIEGLEALGGNPFPDFPAASTAP